MVIIPDFKILYLCSPKCGSSSFKNLLYFIAEHNKLDIFDFSKYGLGEHENLNDIYSRLRGEINLIHDYSVYCHLREPIKRVESFFNFALLDKNLYPFWDSGYIGKERLSFNDWISENIEDVMVPAMTYGNWKWKHKWENWTDLYDFNEIDMDVMALGVGSQFNMLNQAISILEQKDSSLLFPIEDKNEYKYSSNNTTPSRINEGIEMAKEYLPNHKLVNMKFKANSQQQKKIAKDFETDYKIFNILVTAENSE